MPQRSFSSGSYRYGFNGKENDNEVKGTGNQLDYGMRIYDNRLGRFLSVDPLTKEYPQSTPYEFSGNNPLFYVDKNGLYKVTYLTIILKDGRQLQLRHIDNDYVKKQASDFGKYGHKWQVSSDEIVNVTLDLRGNTYKSSSNLINTRPMLFGFDVLDGDSQKQFNTKYDNSEKYGYRIIGATGKPNDYTDGLPKPTGDSKFIDLGALLDITGNFRNEETLISLADKITTLKGMNTLGKIEFGNFIENITTSLGSVMDALGERERLTTEEGSQNNLNTKPKPVERKKYSSDGTFSQGWKTSMDEAKPDTMEKLIPQNKKQ